MHLRGFFSIYYYISTSLKSLFCGQVEKLQQMKSGSGSILTTTCYELDVCAFQCSRCSFAALDFLITCLEDLRLLNYSFFHGWKKTMILQRRVTVVKNFETSNIAKGAIFQIECFGKTKIWRWIASVYFDRCSTNYFWNWFCKFAQ